MFSKPLIEVHVFGKFINHALTLVKSTSLPSTLYFSKSAKELSKTTSVGETLKLLEEESIHSGRTSESAPV